MESTLTESVQQLVRPGKCIDLYYPDPETAQKACYRTSVNTKFTQGFTNLSSGVNTFTISPNNGVGDVICVLQLPPLNTQTGIAVGRGWGYALIKQISWRYGGSPQYFMTGQQVLQAVLSQATDSGSRDALLSLGGNALNGANSDFTNANAAYVFLPLPHSVPSNVGKPPPFPSDLLTQQIQITVELNNVNSIFSLGTGASVANLPGSLLAGSFVLKQVHLANQGDALARHVDMTTHSLTYPVRFIQQEATINITNPKYTSTTAYSSTPNQVSLTGFRSGEVKELHAWLTADSDNPAGGTVGNIVNPFNWWSLDNVVVTYAGDQYQRSDLGCQQLWNLVSGRIPAQVNSVSLATNGAAVSSSTTFTPAWSVLPFGQNYDGASAHSCYMAGMPITNGIVQLSFTVPAAAPQNTAFTLHISYVYNSVLAISQGTCDYVF